MAKKIYIKESSILPLQDKKRLLPQFLYRPLKSHSTSLGDNPSFPQVGDTPFDYAIVKARYLQVLDAFENDLRLGTDNVDELCTILGQWVKECKDMERPIRDELERICENTVIRLFNIPKETINFTCKLVDKITFKSPIRITPESDEEVNYTFADVDDIQLSNKAIAKRRMVDALVQGAAYFYMRFDKTYTDEINALNTELLRKYRDIIKLNDWLLFNKKDEMSDARPMQGSYVETHLGKGDEKTHIDSQGIIFPLLLQDTIKGLFELFASHGLPQDQHKAAYIVKKADFLLSEPWDMRFGVELWRRCFNALERTEMAPYAFVALVSLPTEEFEATVQEILSSTQKGKQILSQMIDDATYEMDYDAFSQRMKERNVDKSVLADSYFTAAELDGFNLDGDDDGNIIEDDKDLMA